MQPLTTTALVVRLVNYGESDRIVTLYGRSVGKVSALARGARASKRRFGPGLALFALGTATLVERRGAELWRLDGFELLRDFSALAQDLGRFAHASYAVELIRELCPPHEVHEGIHDLGAWFLGALGEGEPRPELLRCFELKLLAELGFAPALDRCAACGGAGLDYPGQVFDLRRGGVVCRACARAGKGAGGVILLPAAARAALCRAQAASLAEATRLAFDPADNAVARDVVLAVVTDHVGKPLRSIDFLRKMNQALREE
ncbi:MAG: DNA repair protein RecO [Deltaproteobacteria bacterium]|nr:DNA repair protein RecO [Deltaproteobacteria bacterium]